MIDRVWISTVSRRGGRDGTIRVDGFQEENPRSRPHESGSTLARSLLGNTLRSLHFWRTKRTSPCLPPLIAPCEIRLFRRDSFFFPLQKVIGRIVSSVHETPYSRFTKKKRKPADQFYHLRQTPDLSDSFNWK